MRSQRQTHVCNVFGCHVMTNLNFYWNFTASLSVHSMDLKYYFLKCGELCPITEYRDEEVTT